MRMFKLTLVAAIAMTTVTACTVKDVDTPPLAGPSSLARTIVMTADRDSIMQDGSDFATITLRAQVQPGQSENIRLRAQVFVDGVAQDFGILSNKSPITPTTITYQAPPAPLTAGGQVPTRVTIAVTPFDSGDFRGETTRTIDLQLVPPGVILPSNPNLSPRFTFTPANPQVMTVVSFDATTTTNGGAACLSACTYAWDFGDGTGASGQAVTHQFRRAGNFAVRLTVTDNRGASAFAIQTIEVAPGDPPTATFTTSPTTPGVNQDVFFNASQSTPAPGRTIVSYQWTFGDGNGATGQIVTHRYAVAGVFTTTLTVTDDAGSVATSTKDLTVGQSSGPTPTAEMTCTAGDASSGDPVRCNASASRPGSGSNIESYTFNWGDGSPDEVHTTPLQSHRYVQAGQFQVTLTVRDTLGRTAFKQVAVTVNP